jgi:LemA protein
MDYTSLAIIGVIIAIFYFWYVSIISKRNKALEALSSIDVQLKQRLDLIPNILKIAKKFMEHERTLFKEITALRTKAQSSYNKNDKQSVHDHLMAAEQVMNKMGQLMINVENYPQLKSDQTVMHAMQTYNEVESQISAARRFYNSAVNALNNAVQIFPGNIIAKIAGVSEMPFFEAEEAAKVPVDADQFLR